MSERQSPVVEQKTAVYRPRRGRPAPPPPPLHIPARRGREATRPGRGWLLGLLFVLILVCGTAGLLAAGWSYQRNKILPGVSTLGIPLGGLRLEEAARRLDARWNARRIDLRHGDSSSFTMNLTELGIQLDAEATARAAFREGRDLRAPARTIQVLLGTGTVQPIWYFDPAVARSSLQAIAPRVDVAPISAGIEVVDGQVRATPAKAGQRLDAEATVGWLQQNAVHVAIGEPVPLVVQSVAPQVVNVDALVAELERRLSVPIYLRAFDPISGETEVGEISPEVWANWLTLEAEPEAASPDPTLHVDSTRVAAFVQEQSEALGNNRYFELDSTTEALVAAILEERQEVALRVYHTPRAHVVQQGETLSSIAFDYGIPYPWIQQANPNLGDSLSVGQTITIPSQDELIPLPVVENKRIVVSLSQQRMWAYEDGNLKWEWLVSTGIDSSPTAPGIFQIQSHEPNAYASVWDLWMPQFMGIYRPVPTSDFMNGFHGFPTRNGSNLLWTNSLGRKVTYGCILVSNENIALLYDWAENGVIVEVRP